MDILYNNLMGQFWGLFRNGGKSFRHVSPATNIARLSQPYSGWGAGFIDYNNDGWKDIFSANGDVDDLGANSPQHDTIFETPGVKSSSMSLRRWERTPFERSIKEGQPSLT